jgi:hypothetical protein
MRLVVERAFVQLANVTLLGQLCLQVLNKVRKNSNVNVVFKIAACSAMTLS